MKKQVKQVVAAAVAAIALGAVSSASAQLIVDDFNIAQAALNDSTSDGMGLWSQVGGPVNQILGGQRDIFVTKVGNPADDADGDRVRASVSGGNYRFSSDSGQNGFGIIRWDGVNALPADATDGGAALVTNMNATGLGGVDLTNGGNAFTILVPLADAGFPFTIQVFTDAANYSSLSLFSPGPGVYNIFYSDIMTFGTHVGAGATFTNVGALQAIVNTGGLISDIDFQIDIALIPLPEPLTIGLVGAALLGLGVARRRKAK